MKRISIIISVLVFSLSPLTLAAEEEKAMKEELKTSSEKLSYALGLDIGKSLKELPTEIDLAIFIRGIEDRLKGRETLLTSEEAAELKNKFFKEVREEHAQQRKVIGEENRKKGEAFLAENNKKEGVVVTASGLQYIALKKGDGPKPKATDKVKVHYRGTLLDNTEFDSSYKRGQPISFQVDGVIAGWTEALQLMNVGSKYRLFIPSDLAYGERGAGANIPPDATLIFEVELLAIEK